MSNKTIYFKVTNNIPHIDELRWSTLSLTEQMANIGSEVGRTLKWMEKGKMNFAEGAFIRALDLMDATIKYGRQNSPLRNNLLVELCRARELFAESYQNRDIDTCSYLNKYFGQFASALRR